MIDKATPINDTGVNLSLENTSKLWAFTKVIKNVQRYAFPPALQRQFKRLFVICFMIKNDIQEKKKMNDANKS